MKLFSFCAQTKRCQQETEKARKNEAEKRKFQRRAAGTVSEGTEITAAVWDKATTSAVTERSQLTFRKVR